MSIRWSGHFLSLVVEYISYRTVQESFMLEVNQINLSLVDLDKRIQALRGYL